MINRKTLEKARDWARSTTGVAMKEVRAAEEVIESLPDSWIDADELRAVLEEWEYEPADPSHANKFFRAVEALLPDPATMADIEWKDEDHHLAEATTAEGEAVVMLAEESTDTGDITGVIYCANKRGEVDGWFSSNLTPTGRRFHLVPTGWKQYPEPEPSSAKPESSSAKPEDFDPAYTYRDKDGDKWEFSTVEKAWVCYYHATGDMQMIRPRPPAKYGPYTLEGGTK